MATLHQWLFDWSSWGWPVLANHLWQATIVSTVAFAAAALLKNAPGRARYAVWLIASAKFILPSALLVYIGGRLGISVPSLFSSVREPGQAYTVIYQLASPLNQIAESNTGGAVATRAHNELFCLLTVTWFAGSALLLAIWWRKRRRFRVAMRAKPAADTRERLALGRVRSWLGIKREVDLSVLPGTIEPGVWGVWRPIVLLPQSVAKDLSDAELEAVIMHEMVHVARWDNLVANLHRLLCCLLWFHPIVWILDRLLLSERERACDEEVIRLGGAADVYAASLAKVLRFCLGWSVAGASNATGSNLGRRVERIMSTNVQTKLSVWHRAAIGSMAAIVITLSLAAGLLSHEGVAAQDKKPSAGVAGGVPGGFPGGVPGGVPGGIPGGVAGGISELAFSSAQDLIERVCRAQETAVEFKNSSKAPVIITDARAKAVLRTPDEPGDDYAVLPIISLTNNTDRRIKGLGFEFRNGIERRGYYEFIPSFLEPHAIYTSGASGGVRRLLFLAGGPSGWTVRVAGVVFEDGEMWGTVPPPPPPPPPPMEFKALDQAPEIAIGFRNGDGAPLSITAATVKAARIDPSIQRDGNAEERYFIKLTVNLVNNTGRRITGVAIDYPTPDAPDRMKTYSEVRIDPYGSRRIESPSPEARGISALYLRANPAQMEARVMGVKFEDGEVWGSFPSPTATIPPPPPPQMAPAPDGPQTTRKSGGATVTFLNGVTEDGATRPGSGFIKVSATHQVDAEYPPVARAARITGSVVVEVTIDESGVVTAARVISGHPLLRDAAVTAARQWQFSPAPSGVPMKIVGNLTFTFE